MTILIKNGRVLDPANGIDGVMDVLVKDGKISRVAVGISEQAATIIDADGKWVTPGLIDVHVHFREPGFEHKETIATGARSAAKGGFTTVCCMPNTSPAIDNEIVTEYVKLQASRANVINVLPIGAMTIGQKGETLANIGKMAKAGICAISEDGMSVANSGLFKTAMKYAAQFNLATLSHCEDPTLKSGGVMAAGEQADLLGLPGISGDVEDVIIARDAIIAHYAKARIHICHVSTKVGCYIIKCAKAAGVQITAEVAPHHFTLTDKDIKDYDANFKMAPPLRFAEDVAALREGLKDGTIDMIATDHAPHHRDEKNCEFDKAANGIVGLETSVALSITELVRSGLLTPSELIEKMAFNPAKLINSDRGTLSIGRPADITIIDPDAYYAIDPETFVSKARNTPFGGRKVYGNVEYTIRDGLVIVENGELKEEYR